MPRACNASDSKNATAWAISSGVPRLWQKHHPGRHDRHAQRLGLPRIDAQLLLLHALGRPDAGRAWLLAHDTDAMDEATHAQFIALCQRRVAGEPVAAQVAALLAGDVDLFPRVTPRSVPQFKTNPRFQVLVSGSRAKTILAINNARKPLDDVRVRRAIAAAIDRRNAQANRQGGFGGGVVSHIPGDCSHNERAGTCPYPDI